MAERWIRRTLLVLGALVGVFVLSGCQPASRAFEVTTTADGVDGAPGDGVCATADGACTLRAAVMEANASDDLTVVVLEPKTYQLNLSGSDEDHGLTGDLDVQQSTHVLGHGAVVDGGGLDRVFDLHDGAVSLSQVTVRNGSVTGDGGGIRNRSDGLSLFEAAIIDNVASGAGGGLFNGTSVGIVNASFFDNIAGVDLGGAAANGPHGQMVVAATTVTGNRAGDRGGGLRSVSGSATNRLEILHSIVTDNGTSSDGTSSDCAVPEAPGATSTIESVGFNIESGISCGFDATGDRRGDPRLGPIVIEDDAPAYRRPLPGSVLLDAIPQDAPRCHAGRDQRGVPRPQGSACEIGAVEVEADEVAPLSVTVDSSGDSVDLAPGDRVCADASSACSLRAAVMETNAFPTDDTIVIGEAIDPQLSIEGRNEDQSRSGDLDIADDLTIEGAGATVDANAIDRVIDVKGGVGVVINDTTIAGGHALLACGAFNGGGGLRNDTGAVTFNRSTITDNRSSGSNWTQGGALLNRTGEMRVYESSIVGNAVEAAPCAASGGTALGLGGGVYNAGALEIRRSTVYRNRVTTLDGTKTGAGGGLFNDRGTASVIASTIARNGADSKGSGVMSIRFEGVGTMTLRGTLLASNHLMSGGAGDNSACGDARALHPLYVNGITSEGYNLATNGGCPFAPPLDIDSAFEAGELADNGGPTPTIVLAPGLPAVDVIPAGEPGLCDGVLATDQRGAPRPFDGDGDGDARCDIGATESTVEPAPISLVVDSPADLADASPGDGLCRSTGSGQCTLRAAVQETNAWPTTDAISIADGVDPTLTRTGADDDAVVGDLDLTDDVAIDGNGAVVSGGRRDRVFHVMAGVTISDMTVRDGLATDGAGVRNSGGNLVMDQVTVTANEGATGGGIRNDNGGVLVMSNSTISGNVASTNGGAIYNTASGMIHLRFTTIAANSSGAGGALRVTGEVRAAGSIVESTSPGSACSAPLTSEGGNVASDTSCGFTDPTDRQGVEARLGPLADNDGSTPTHAPLGGSPAIDLAPAVSPPCSSITADQRGMARPVGAGCDAGSVERSVLGPLSLTVDVSADTVDVLAGDGTCADVNGACSLRAAVLEANAWPGRDTIVVEPGVDPVLTRDGSGDTPEIGDIDVHDQVHIVGDGAVVSTAAGWDSRVLQFASTSGGSDVEALTITGGDTAEAGGGIRTAAALTIRDTTITGNHTGGSGGGLYVSATGAEADPSTWVVVENSTVSGNAASGTGGGLTGASGSYVSLAQTTITNNSSGSGGAIGGPGPKRTVASIVAVQSAGADCTAPMTSLAYNVSSDATCGFTQPGDAQGVDVRLGVLRDNGGPTRTHLPSVGSPVVDRVPSLVCATVLDQRGRPRPSGSACDAGAVERQPSDLLVAQPSPESSPDAPKL
jgi:CSLREA domain-containing protein